MGKQYTIMFLSDKNGRRYSLKVSCMIVVLIVLFIIFLAVSTVLLLTSNLSLKKQNTFYENKLGILKEKMISLNEGSREACLYKQWADRIIFRRMNYDVSATGAENPDGLNMRSGEVPGSKKNLLDVDEFDVQKINLGLDFEVSCKLINLQRGSVKQEGYLFILASNRDVTPPVYSSWPSAEIKSGLPHDYNKGLKFAIRYLKIIKCRINQPDIGPGFNRVDVVVFSDDGKILMKKGFYIERFLSQAAYECK